eukprot:7188287-Pyramimonas_sp.AAC.1
MCHVCAILILTCSRHVCGCSILQRALTISTEHLGKQHPLTELITDAVRKIGKSKTLSLFTRTFTTPREQWQLHNAS